MASSRDPPTYHESLWCDVLKPRRVAAAPRHPAAFDGDIIDHPLQPADVAHDAIDFVASSQDVIARLSAATEHNAAEFIWYELPKPLKTQWAQSDLRSVLDDCTRCARRNAAATVSSQGDNATGTARLLRAIASFGCMRISSAAPSHRRIGGERALNFCDSQPVAPAIASMLTRVPAIESAKRRKTTPPILYGQNCPKV